MFVFLAISTDFVGLQFQEVLNSSLVLRRPLGSGVWRASGHGVVVIPRWKNWSTVVTGQERQVGDELVC